MKKIKLEFPQFLEKDNREVCLPNYYDCGNVLTSVKLPIMEAKEPQNFYPPVLAEPVPNGENVWRPATFENDEPKFETRKNYLETSSVFSLKNGEVDKKILDAKLKIVAVIKEIHEDEVCKIWYRCQIASVGDMTREFIVKAENFKDIFREIQRKFPEFFLPELNSEAVREYLSDVYQRDINSAKIEIIFSKIGWNYYGGILSYDIGYDEFYRTTRIPQVDFSEHEFYFDNAWKFLEIGKNGVEISIIWLMAHIAFTNHFFKLAGHIFSSVLYVRGTTNLLKTSVVKVVANVFDANRDNATLRMTSTTASIAHSLFMLRDNLVIVDDFSSTECKSKNKALENAETVIRAVGDGILPTKMNPQDFSKSLHAPVRCAVILTGEEQLDLGSSSHYRTIEVFIEQGTFDGKILREFQDDPQIMAKYFSMYVQYLKQNGLQIAEYVKQNFSNYRRNFEEKFSIPRFAETATLLQIQVEILSNFARYCRQSTEAICWYEQILSQNCVEIVQKNQNSGETMSPALKFLQAVFQSINTTANNKIADNEEIYISAESKFIGFNESQTNLLWLRPTEVYQIAVNFYKNRGENFLTSWDSLKKNLFREGFSEGKKYEDGLVEYVKRAKKGSRRRMLVLKIEKINEALENLGGDF